MSGKSMTVIFLCLPVFTFDTMHYNNSNNVDLSYIDSMRHLETLYQHYSPPSWPLPFQHNKSLKRRNATSDRKKLVAGTKDSSRWFRQNPRLVAGMGRASGRNENNHDGRSDYMPGPRTRMDNH